MHAEGELILGDAGEGLRMGELVVGVVVEVVDGIQCLAAHGAVHAGGVGHVENGVALGAALDTLVDGGDEAGGKAILATIGLGAAGDQDNVAGQVLVFRTESVSCPGAEGGAAGLGETGVQEQLRRGVVELVGMHGLDEAEVIRDLVQVRDGIRHPDAVFTVLLEGAWRPHELGRAAGEGEGFTLEEGVRAVLAVPFHQLGLVVKHVKVRRGAGEVEVNDTLCLGGVVGGFG